MSVSLCLKGGGGCIQYSKQSDEGVLREECLLTNKKCGGHSSNSERHSRMHRDRYNTLHSSDFIIRESESCLGAHEGQRERARARAF